MGWGGQSVLTETKSPGLILLTHQGPFSVIYLNYSKQFGALFGFHTMKYLSCCANILPWDAFNHLNGITPKPPEANTS